MSRTQLLWLLDRAPRVASLLGLLGLIGLAGVIDPELYRFSALSALSFLAFFRFFRRFVDPGYGPTAQFIPFLLLAMIAVALGPWLIALTPVFGLVGLVGFAGLLAN
jgi:hypothetical protein